MKFFRSFSMRRSAFTAGPSQTLASTNRSLFNIFHQPRLFSSLATKRKVNARIESRYDDWNAKNGKHHIIRQIVSAVEPQTNDIEFFIMPPNSCVPLLFRYVEDGFYKSDEEKNWCGLNIRARRRRRVDGGYHFTHIDEIDSECSLICKIVGEDILYYFPPGETPLVFTLGFTENNRKYQKCISRIDELTPKLHQSWSIQPRATREQWLFKSQHNGIATLIQKVYTPLGIKVAFPNSSNLFYNAVLSTEFGSYRIKHQFAHLHMGSFRCQWAALRESNYSFDELFDFCVVPIEDNSVIKGFFIFPKTVYRDNFSNRFSTTFYPPFQPIVATHMIKRISEQKNWQEQFYVNMAGGVDFDKFRQILKMYAPQKMYEPKQALT